jgi:hypothetical protein
MPCTGDTPKSEDTVAPGIVVGYKLVTSPGLTLNPQFAYDVLIGDGSPRALPRLALNAGWSF